MTQGPISPENSIEVQKQKKRSKSECRSSVSVQFSSNRNLLSKQIFWVSFFRATIQRAWNSFLLLWIRKKTFDVEDFLFTFRQVGKKTRRWLNEKKSADKSGRRWKDDATFNRNRKEVAAKKTFLLLFLSRRFDQLLGVFSIYLLFTLSASSRKTWSEFSFLRFRRSIKNLEFDESERRPGTLFGFVVNRQFILKSSESRRRQRIVQCSTTSVRSASRNVVRSLRKTFSCF